MKVLHRIDGQPNIYLILSEIKKAHLRGDNSISFTNFNNMVVTVWCSFEGDGKFYILECQNGIKNFKKTLKEVKRYIKENSIK